MGEFIFKKLLASFREKIKRGSFIIRAEELLTLAEDFFVQIIHKLFWVSYLDNEDSSFQVAAVVDNLNEVAGRQVEDWHFFSFFNLFLHD